MFKPRAFEQLANALLLANFVPCWFPLGRYTYLQKGWMKEEEKPTKELIWVLYARSWTVST